MSSLTTNLKLVKPELQDNITPTIFADNFDKIDAALEGVSGGALSLEEIEASTNLDGKIPSAAALKEVNNSLQDSLSGIGAIFIDTTNLLHTINKASASWTATENCICTAFVNGESGNGAVVYLDDVRYLVVHICQVFQHRFLRLFM